MSEKYNLYRFQEDMKMKTTEELVESKEWRLRENKKDKDERTVIKRRLAEDFYSDVNRIDDANRQIKFINDRIRYRNKRVRIIDAILETRTDIKA